MIPKDSIRQLAFESLQKLKEMNLLNKDFKPQGDTVLLGMGSPLDSAAFTMFIVDLESAISQQIGRNFTINAPALYNLQQSKESLFLNDVVEIILETLKNQNLA